MAKISGDGIMEIIDRIHIRIDHIWNIFIKAFSGHRNKIWSQDKTQDTCLAITTLRLGKYKHKTKIKKTLLNFIVLNNFHNFFHIDILKNLDSII